MAIKNNKKINETKQEAFDRRRGFLFKREDAPYIEKKEYIAQLRNNIGIEPTEGDYELALYAKYNEYGQSIIKKIGIFKEILFLSDIPYEIIQYITLLIFETKESLL